ncbi:hypothetical protein [Sulfobacillus harzensis]|uniref:Uncharacterized protein n=1 Tax=Sulfobacillus harzensis TaxID=2729629 RepID=A0A7Y0L2Y7_9FIRM|nr:hypothetical protein [Sulfobacillus harzensis]NMP22123.1 hypothetical protein [Sulfobacillus harzensis]
MSFPVSDLWLEAETALGYHAYYGLHLSGIKKLVVLYGPSHTILDRIADTYAERGAHIARWHSVYDPEALTGVVLRPLGVAWISGEIARRVTPSGNVSVESLMVGPELPSDVDRTIKEYQARIKQCLVGCAAAMAEYELAAQGPVPSVEPWVRNWRNQLLGQRAFSSHPVDIHSFGSPLTADGPDQRFLADSFSRLDLSLHLINGLPGMSSRLIRRFGETALMQGHTVHFYHDALKPSRVNHVVLPQLGIGMTDSTAPYDVPGGRQRIVVDAAFGRQTDVDGAESWWTIYQTFYHQAWQLLDEIRTLRREWSLWLDIDIARLASRCTA